MSRTPSRPGSLWRRVLGATTLGVLFSHSSPANAGLQETQLAEIQAAATRVLATDPELAAHVRLVPGTPMPSLLQIRYQQIEETHAPICTLAIWAPADETIWRRYLPAAPRVSDRGPLLEALVAHELTHCREFLTAYADFEHSTMVVPSLRSTVHNFDDLSRVIGRRDQSLWNETIAALGAMLYLQEHYPDRFRALHQSWIEYRHRNTADPGHDTSAMLDVTLSRGSDEPVLTAANRLRQVAFHLL